MTTFAATVTTVQVAAALNALAEAARNLQAAANRVSRSAQDVRDAVNIGGRTEAYYMPQHVTDYVAAYATYTALLDAAPAALANEPHRHELIEQAARGRGFYSTPGN